MNTSTLDRIVDPVVHRIVDPVVHRIVEPVAQTFHDVTDRLSSRVGGNRRVLGTSIAVLAIGAVVGFAVAKLVKASAVKKEQKSVEARRDKTLKESFPASDPPASQFYDIPVNRQ